MDMSNTSQIVLPQIAQDRLNRLEARTARIGVIGLGYVGLPLSLLLSEAGFKVTGFDIDTKKVTDLEAGRSYIFRIPAAEIQSARQTWLHGHHRLRASVGSGRHHHVRADAADRAPRAGPELRGEHCQGRGAMDSRRPTGGTGEHNLPGNDGRVDDPGARGGKYARAESAERRERRRNMASSMSPFRRSAKIRAM